MKILDLILCHKWYDMIESGEKPEEYRDDTAYWTKRLCKYGKVKRGFGKQNICFTDCNCKLNKCYNHVPTVAQRCCSLSTNKKDGGER